MSGSAESRATTSATSRLSAVAGAAIDGDEADTRGGCSIPSAVEEESVGGDAPLPTVEALVSTPEADTGGSSICRSPPPVWPASLTEAMTLNLPGARTPSRQDTSSRTVMKKPDGRRGGVRPV